MIWSLLKLGGGWAWGILRAIPWQAWAAAGCVVLAWWLHGAVYDQGAASRDAEVAVLSTHARVLEAAQAGNLETIAQLEAANAEWSARLKFDSEQAARAVADLSQETERLQGELLAARDTREKTYQGDQHAKSWADTAVPAAVARGLFDD